MRDFGKIGPTFWTRGTGKKLRGDAVTQVVAVYLMSAPTSNMIGLYYLPVSTISHDTGSPFEGASKALRRGQEEAFCTYDEQHETVFVHSMALRQLGLEDGEVLSPKDNRVKAIVKLMKECGSAYLLELFYQRYSVILALPTPWWSNSTEAPSKPLASPLQAPCKPLRSQETETETDQKTEMEREGMQGEPNETTPELAAPIPPKPVVAIAPLVTVEIQSKPEAKAARKCQLPADWKPKASHKAKAKELGLTVAAEAEAFSDHFQARGTTMLDWDKAFFTWLRNAPKYGPAAPPKAFEPEYIEVPDDYDSEPAMTLAEATQYAPEEFRKPIQEFLGGFH